MLASQNPASGTLDFLSGGGAMGAMIRAHDWTRTPLGPPAGWPQGLRTAIRLMLGTSHPVYIFWGSDLLCFYNDAYSHSIGPEHHPVSLGQPAREVWNEAWEIVGPQIEQVMSGRGATWHENHLIPITRHGKREDVYWTYSYGPIDEESAPNGVGGVLVICTETTRQILLLKRAGQQLQTRSDADITAALLASIVDSSQDAILSKDLNGIIRSWNAGAEHMFGYSAAEAIGQPITMLIPDDLLEQEPEILRRILSGGRIEHFETVRKRKDGSLVDISLTVSPVRDGSGAIIGASKVARDITEARKAQQKRKLLLREMNHRIKNLFAVVSGVVAISARGAGLPRELIAAIQARLGALARAHDLTLQADPEDAAPRPAQLGDLVRAVLAPYGDGNDSAIVIAGPEVACGANAAIAFALLLHEFATNAVKYGALTSPAGHIGIEWRLDEKLTLVWRETGGPAPPSTEQEGFGGTLVRATISGLSGDIARAWEASGLTITLTVPAERLRN